MFMGAAVGASQRSFRALKSGALGGLVAGFITGAVFDVLSNMLSSLVTPFNAANVPAGFQPEGGAPGRALMAFGMGLLIGLFTALVDMATRRAWLRLVLGRNEGKEWPIDAVQTLIGRDERAHVPLFGDPQIPSLAAVIVKQGNSYILQDPGSPIGVGHNGVRVPQAQLSSGDTIQIGNLNFQFMMKAGQAGAHEGRAKAVPVGGPGYPQQPQQQQYPQHAPAQPQYQQPQPYGAQPGPQQTIAYTQQPMQPVQQTPQQTMAYPSPQAMAAPAGPGLVVTSGPMTGQRIAVNGPLDIGREGSGLAIGYDAQASRRHANVAPGPGGIQITDLGSTNGTFVNGQRIPSAILRPGDTVTIGSTSFRVE
jgi:pSer/pThr/pTyr-binding forkhead associated (FHA) protein